MNFHFFPRVSETGPHCVVLLAWQFDWLQTCVHPLASAFPVLWLLQTAPGHNSKQIPFFFSFCKFKSLHMLMKQHGPSSSCSVWHTACDRTFPEIWEGSSSLQGPPAFPNVLKKGFVCYWLVGLIPLQWWAVGYSCRRHPANKTAASPLEPTGAAMLSWGKQKQATVEETHRSSA